MPWYFAEFLMIGRTCPGVFLVSQQAPIGEVIDALVLIWRDQMPKNGRTAL
jgi:hypothetical protein